MKKIYLPLATLAWLGAGMAAESERAVVAADLLARADRAAADPSRGATAALAKAVAALDGAGVRADPTATEASAAFDGWRRRAGSTVPPTRGRVLGPAFRRGWLEAGGSARLDQLFLAGQAASIAVAGTPHQAVRLAVAGPDAPAGCTGGDRSCRWTPIFTQRYTITVRNAGRAATRYYLVMD